MGQSHAKRQASATVQAPVDLRCATALLEAIDRDEKDAWMAQAERLFTMYDLDGSGRLEADEFNEVLDALAVYMTREYDRVYGHTDMPYSKEQIKSQLKWELDSNFDGVIDKDEFITNVKLIVDTTDS